MKATQNMILSGDRRHRMGSEGFTLIEAIIALAILTIGILSVNAMQTVSTRGNMTASDITMASGWAADEVERIFNLAYDDPLLDDNGGGVSDGTNQDTNKNGLDDDGVDAILNFGLDNATAATADGMTTSNDPAQRYTIYWNVAVDMPIPNIKTIQVIVSRQDRGVTKSVTIRHTKALFM